MAGEKHVYLVAKGSYIHADLSAEQWQTGTRLWADTSSPADQGTLPTTGDFGIDAGSLAGSNWNITTDWNWTDGLGPVFDPLAFLDGQACPAWTTFMGAAAITAKCQLDSLTLYPILDTGKVFSGGGAPRKAVAEFIAAVPGSETANMMPPEVSIAMSLQTPQAGRRGRGRMFLPPTGVGNVGTDGFLTGGLTTSIALAGVALMEGLSVTSLSPGDPHVRPIVTGSPWTRYGVVTSVNVGDVFDAQRRRRRQLLETRHSEDTSY